MPLLRRPSIQRLIRSRPSPMPPPRAAATRQRRAYFVRCGLIGTVGIMATRAPNGARPKGGASGRSRSASTAKRPRGGAGPVRRPARGGRTRAGRRGSVGRRYQPPPPTNPFVILIGWASQVIAAAWMALAHTVGAAARALGRNTRDLDPAHRRDRARLTLLGLAIIMAAVSWFRLGSVVARGLSFAVRDGVGAAAWAVPLLLALLAWRYLRHPDREAGTARLGVGWAALILRGRAPLHAGPPPRQPPPARATG